MFSWIKSKALALVAYVATKAKAIVDYFSRKGDSVEKVAAQAAQTASEDTVADTMVSKAGKVLTVVKNWFISLYERVIGFFSTSSVKPEVEAGNQAAAAA